MPQIQVWINKDDTANVEKLVKVLNNAVLAKRTKKLKAFLIFVDATGKAIEPKLTEMANKLNAQDVALAYLPPTHEAIGDYKINLDPKVKNTIMLYRNREVTWQRVNLKSDDADLAALHEAIEKLTK